MDVTDYRTTLLNSWGKKNKAILEFCVQQRCIFLKKDKQWHSLASGIHENSLPTDSRYKKCWRKSFRLKIGGPEGGPGGGTHGHCWGYLVVPYTQQLLRVPFDSKEVNQLVLKETNSGYSLERLMLNLKLQHFGHQMWRTDSMEKTLMLGKTEDRRRRGLQRMR